MCVLPGSDRMENLIPRITIASLKGGSGKTIFSLGLTAAWREKGYRVAPFKKGPDFIDSGWLAFAAGRPCYNLDPFMMRDEQILMSFLSHSRDVDVSLIEGNRGLFDGLDTDGCCSTAELGRLLQTPVIIIADVTMATRTIAAVILGCQKFDPELQIQGVILNRVAGKRQENLIRNTIDQYCGIPVVGAVPKLTGNIFPERHMGLVPYQERSHAEKAIAWARRIVEDHLDMEAIWRMAHRVDILVEPRGHGQRQSLLAGQEADPPRVGIVKDESFSFYYPENLDKFRTMGALVHEVNSLKDEELPDLDALYVGGGFPEALAEALTRNVGFRASLKGQIERGLPVYAECGGLMYLAENIIVDEIAYPMVGILPLDVVLEKKPQGHGYTILEVRQENPYYSVGEILKGHEFHYSRPIIRRPEALQRIFKVKRGYGLDGETDGLCTKNLLATYTHLHATGYTPWGEALIRAATHFRELKKMKGSQKKC